jgi:excisionase family DNA binding protein
MTPKIRTFTVPEVCGLLRIGRATLYRLFKSKVLKGVKVGRTRRVRESDLERYLDRATD